MKKTRPTAEDRTPRINSAQEALNLMDTIEESMKALIAWMAGGPPPKKP